MQSINNGLESTIESLKENKDLIKTAAIIIILNIVASVAIMYYTKGDDLQGTVNDIMNGVWTERAKGIFINLGLVFIVSCVIGYTAYRGMVPNQEYGSDIINNLRLYISDIKNILVNLIPVGLTYVITTDLINKLPGNDTESEAMDKVAVGFFSTNVSGDIPNSVEIDAQTDTQPIPNDSPPLDRFAVPKNEPEAGFWKNRHRW